MSFYGNPKLTKNAQALRRNMTKEARHLWYDFLKTLPIPIYRQKTFHHYILDFYCAKANIVIELAGTQHLEDKGAVDDRVRDAYLKKYGLTILRYSNADIHNRFESVCEDIYQHIVPFIPSSDG